MASKPEVEVYEVEANKRGLNVRLKMHVTMVRGLRGRRKLYGESRTYDTHTPEILFRVQHASDLDDLLGRFIRQLIHRGYRPLRSRAYQDGAYEDWVLVDPEKFDMSELDKSDSRASFIE